MLLADQRVQFRNTTLCSQHIYIILRFHSSAIYTFNPYVKKTNVRALIHWRTLQDTKWGHIIPPSSLATFQRWKKKSCQNWVDAASRTLERKSFLIHILKSWCKTSYKFSGGLSQIMVFWNVTRWTLVHRYQCFGTIFRLRQLFLILSTPLLKTEAVGASETYLTRLHGVTSPEGRNVIYITLRTSHFIHRVKADRQCSTDINS